MSSIEHQQAQAAFVEASFEGPIIPREITDRLIAAKVAVGGGREIRTADPDQQSADIDLNELGIVNINPVQEQ